MTESYPLSPLQHGMLFQSLLERHPGVDLVHALGWIHGAWEPERFRAAWERVTARHEMMRSSVHWDNTDQPFQTIHPDAMPPFTVLDWRGASSTACEEKWRAFLHEDRMRGIDFEQPPLLRVHMIRTGWRRWRFCLTFHHIMLDGAGLTVLIDEVFALFDGAEVLPPAPSFRDYIEWHQRQDWTAAEAFWRNELSDFTRPVPMVLAAPAPPPDENRDACAGFHGHFSRQATQDLERLAQQTGVTLNTVMQAGWALLLSRHMDTDDVVFGATRRCRKSNVPGAERTVGMLVNTVPFRVAIRREQKVRGWLRGVLGRWDAMRDFENTPLLLVQGWSSVPRGARLFETIFNFFQPGWDHELVSRKGPWTGRKLALSGQAGVYVTMAVYAGIPEMEMEMVYDTRRMDAEAVHRIMDQYRTILASFAAAPDKLLSSVEMMSPRERQLVMQSWNPAPARYPSSACIHEIFADQARRTPQGVALKSGGKLFTYEKLDQRANRISRLLRRRGVQRGSMVGLCLERSLDLIAGMLAILKAGGTIVPLDPEFPPPRMTLLFQDTGAEVVVTHERFRDRLPDVDAVCLDSAKAEIAALSSDPLPVAGQTEDIACIFHTSGSTGTPKGVRVPHRGITRLVKNNNYAPFGPGEVFLQFAPVSFDAASFEIWGPLLNGGQLVLFPPGMPSLAELGAFIQQEKITVLWATTGLFASLLEHDPVPLRGVRHIFTGGSVMPAAATLRARRELPDCRLVNCYGPTENSTFTTWFDIGAAPIARLPVPIGRPIAHTTVYVLDGDLRPVPVGVPGELCTGGDGVARGYLNDPALTAEKFVPDPFASGPDARLYRSGDMVRWLADGNLEFIGRLDQQVKIRGFRVEPGEVENVISAHPGVARAIVLVREDTVAGPGLHAWYEPGAGGPESADLLSFLRSRLPSYLLPVTLTAVESMPLKTNGKIDAAALPEWAPTASATEEYGFTPTQEIVRGMFSAVLGGRKTGLRDNFFEVGGHSLKAMQLVALLGEAFGVPVPVRTLFSAPTAEALAGWIDAALQSRQEASLQPETALVALRPGGIRPPLFVIPGGWGGGNEMLVFARLASHLPSTQPFYAFNAGAVQRDRVPDVGGIARRYLEEIKQVVPAGPVLLAGECITGVIAFEMARMLEEEGRQAHLFLLDAWCPNPARLVDLIEGKAGPLPEEIRCYYEVLLGNEPGHWPGVLRIIASETSVQANPTLGWDANRHGELQIAVVPGDHHSYLRENATATAATLQLMLDALPGNC